MARQKINGVQLADRAGMSRDYLGKRLRDETAFTANDIEAICNALSEDLAAFLLTAVRAIGRDA